MEIRKLNAGDYDELLEMLNYTFGNKYGRKMDFVAEQPKMWVRSDEYMNKHIGVFEDGKLVSVLGIYPLPVKILGKDFLFMTTGNLATHPDYEGRGYFTKLFEMGMEELKKAGADVARLGGARQRYGRFGFSQCSSLYYFVLNEQNCKRGLAGYGEGVEIKKIERNDTEILKFCMDLCNSQKFYVERYPVANYRDVYTVMCSKESAPYVAIKDGKPIGYLCVYKDMAKLHEVRAISTDAYCDTLCAFRAFVGTQINVPVAPYNIPEFEIMSRVANEISVNSPSKFKIINFCGITDAFMKLKRTYANMPEGELIMDIEDYGKIRIYSDATDSGCEMTDKAADITVNKDMATRIIFGFEFALTNNLPDFAKIWFPLPLSWDFMDYV